MPQSKTDRDIWKPKGEITELPTIIDFIKFNREKSLNRSHGRKEDSKEVYDYYWGVRQVKLLEQEMKKRFPDTWNTRRKHIENVTKTVVDSVSVVYKSPPDRVVTAEIDEEVSEEERETLKEMRDELQSEYDRLVSKSKMDFTMQKLERYQNFDRTNLVQVKFVNDRLKLLVYPQFLFDVMMDENGDVAVVILSDFRDERLEEFRNYWIWTADSFWKLDKDLMNIPLPENPNNENPYGDIPFVLARRVVPDDGVYCEADLNLSLLNLNVNLLLTDSLHLSEFQAHGQLVGKNIKMASNPGWGPENVVQYEQKNSEADSSLEYLTPNANFEGLFNTVNRILGGFANSRGLPTNMFSNRFSLVWL